MYSVVVRKIVKYCTIFPLVYVSTNFNSVWFIFQIKFNDLDPKKIVNIFSNSVLLINHPSNKSEHFCYPSVKFHFYLKFCFADSLSDKKVQTLKDDSLSDKKTHTHTKRKKENHSLLK